MPSTKKTKKTAKPATTRAVSKAKAKTTMPKATAARAKAKSARTTASKASARPATKSKARSATAARASAKTARASTASKAPSKAAATKASAKSRAVARATATGASKSAQVASKSVKAASKAAQVKAAQAKAAKAQKAKSAAKSASAKASVTKSKVEAINAAATKAASVKKVDHTAKKPVEGRVKEASAEKFKAFHNKKASSDTQNQSKPNAKSVPHASAHPAAVSTKPVVGKVEAQPVRPSVVAGTAPDPRPASPAPVVQPRDTSEQNPVTQKKSASQTNAKPPLKAISTPEQAKPETAAVAPPPAPKPAKPTGAKLGFKTHEHIVYPAHGVGQIVAIEEQEVAGFRLELFVISFVKDKMILKVPTPKVVSVGMRKLAEPHVITRSLDTLTGRARIKRTMWSRRAQEYEAKINSGDLIAIAEVVRDLYRSEAQPEQSYSERQLYEAALDRMSRELAVVQKLTELESLKLIEAQLQKGPRRGAKAEAEVDAEGEAGDVDEAA